MLSELVIYKRMMKVPRNHRISVDRDNFNQLRLLMTYYNMKRICTDVFVWETNHGYHIYGRFPNRTTEQNLDMRRMLGDDPRRIALDEGRINAGVDYLSETLFVFGKIMKGKNQKITHSIEQPCNVLSMQFWGSKHVKR